MHAYVKPGVELVVVDLTFRHSSDKHPSIQASVMAERLEAPRLEVPQGGGGGWLPSDHYGILKLIRTHTSMSLLLPRFLRACATGKVCVSKLGTSVPT